MKKFVSIVLALTMILSMATVAFAASDNVAASEAKTIEFNKEYKTTAGKAPATYPAETLKFTVAKDSNNPADTMITIADQTVDANPDTIVITVPAYSVVGKYNYTVSEVAGNTQGVTYSAATFGVQVLATYNADHSAIVTEVVFTTGEANDKLDTITNNYDLGALNVTKTVTGNLGSTTKEFTVHVTFNATKDVKSDITYVDGNETKTITAAAMADKTETVDITVKHDETVSFTNIPAGITYTVVEDATHLTGDVNGEEGYEATYTNAEGTIVADTTAEAGIINDKSTTVDTGISMDTIPYIVVLAVAVMGLVAVVANKRRAAEF